MRILKQSTSATVVIGPFVDDADGKTAETTLTLSQADIRLSKNGGAFAQKGDTNSATHMENGMYSCALNTTDTGTAGVLSVLINESGALMVRQDYMVLAADAYDALVSDSGNGILADAATSVTSASLGSAYGNKTLMEALKTMFAVLAGKASGMGTTTAVFRNIGDTADVVTATVDASGNRTSVTLNP